jgi:hypothetical protein
LSGCATIVVTRKPETRTYAAPTYQSSRAAFFWGLYQAEPDLELDQICLGKDADQVSFTYRPTDILETVVTLGIYSPRTVRVWCAL